jgi:hypothetical protein
LLGTFTITRKEIHFMAHEAKTLSVRNLHAAVKAALQATKKQYPDAKFGAIDPADPTARIPMIYRPYLIIGYPPCPFRDLGGVEQGVKVGETFSRNLASDPALAALAIDGKLEPTMIISGDSISFGVVGGGVPINE